MIGVDVGGTKVAAALIRARLPAPGLTGPPPAPVILDRVTAPSRTATAEESLEGIVAVIERLVPGAGGLDGIGIGAPSTVDFAAGRLVATVHLPLADVPLRDLMSGRFGVPVAVDNDATAAAIGEWAFGAGVGTRDMLMLTLGTGVGGGIIAGGRPYRGSSGAAAELGHIIVDVDGPPCPGDCPSNGCLEAFVSGTAMGRAAAEQARRRPQSSLGRALAAGETVDSRLLTRLGLAGDPDAVELLTRTGELLGAGLVTLVNAFNPERILIGGGAAAAGELLFAPARRVVARRALRPGRDEVRILPAALGMDAGVIGAAALALMELFPDAPGPLS